MLALLLATLVLLSIVPAMFPGGVPAGAQDAAPTSPAPVPTGPTPPVTPADPTPATTTSDATTPGPAATGQGVDQAPVVRLARATWDTGWFQAEVHRQLLMRIGYQVDRPLTMDNRQFFDAVAAGDVDMWANGWFPLHEPLLEPGTDLVGTQVDDGALTGYFMDLATAEELGVTSIADLADPDVAAVFDIDGNGLADLHGCNVEWACAPQVDHHLDVFGLTTTVEQVQADYSALMTEVIDRQRDGLPVLLYGFTPHWILAELAPGENLRWLQVPRADLPDQPGLTDADTRVPGLPGCAADPCQTGFPPNDIRAVANADFLDAHPDVRTLLELVEIPLEDIQAQNDLMYNGLGSEADLRAQAAAWITDNEVQVEEWVAQAAPDAVPVTGGDGTGVGTGAPLRVVVRTLEPFVLYEGRRYSGYSVEFMEALGARMGREIEIYGVNSVAKELDDVERGVADLALTAIAITSEREELVDFSLPVFQSGLSIMVASEANASLFARAADLVGVIFASGLPWLVVLFLVVLLFSAHAIWWFERRDNPDFPLAYRSGIWDSFWWATVTVTTVGYGDKTPRGRAGQGFALLWMIVGYFVFASFTASITTSLAVNELQGGIAGPSDLPGNEVGTLATSPGEDWLVNEGIPPTIYGTLDELFAALEDGDVDAVVFDTLVVKYIASRDTAFETVGPSFETVRYGIAVNDDQDALREEVNLAFLDLIEAGVYDQLTTRWFGELQEE